MFLCGVGPGMELVQEREGPGKMFSLGSTTRNPRPTLGYSSLTYIHHHLAMPIRYTVDPATPGALKDATEDYIVFYSSRDEHGRLWCPVRPYASPCWGENPLLICRGACRTA